MNPLLRIAEPYVADRRPARLPAILVVTPIYPWPGRLSEGIFLHRQVQRLARLGHPVRVTNFHPAVPGLPRSLATTSWLRYHPRWMRWSGRQDGIRVDHIFHHQHARNRSDAIPIIADAVSRHLDRHLDGFIPDVIYGNWLWKGGAVAVAMGERYGWPVAAIARGSELHRWQSIHRYCLQHVEDVVHRADLLLANCEFLRSRAASITGGNAQSIQVAYNGCDTSLFQPAVERTSARRELGFSDHARYFVSCGTVIEHKGQGDLARAWMRFAPSHPDWRLIVLGPVVDHHLARELRSAYGATVEVRGQVQAHEIPRYLQAADAYVQPSRLEGLSNATMEAMSTGLPVVTTDAGGQRELMDGSANGWMAAVANPASLASALQALAADADGAAVRGTAARHMMTNRFEATQQAGRLSMLLTELSERKQRPLDRAPSVRDEIGAIW